jgi:hypothetical protein
MQPWMRADSTKFRASSVSNWALSIAATAVDSRRFHRNAKPIATKQQIVVVVMIEMVMKSVNTSSLPW